MDQKTPNGDGMSHTNNNSDSSASFSFKLLSLYKMYRSCQEIKRQCQELELGDVEVTTIYFHKKNEREKECGFRYVHITKDWVGDNVERTLNATKREKFKKLWEKESKSIKDYEFFKGFSELEEAPEKDWTKEQRRKWVELLFECLLDRPVPYKHWKAQNVAYRVLKSVREPLAAVYIKYKLDENNKEIKVSKTKYWKIGKETGMDYKDKKEDRKGNAMENEEQDEFFDKVFEIFYEISQIQDYHFCLFPIYDVYLKHDSPGHGGIMGFVFVFWVPSKKQAPTKKQAPIEKQVEKLIDIVKPNLPHFSNDIIQSRFLQIEKSRYVDSSNFMDCLSDIIAEVLGIRITYKNKTDSICQGKEYCRWNLREAVKIFLDESEEGKYEELLNPETEIRYEYPEIAVIPEEQNEKNLFESKLQEQQLRILEILINKHRRFKSAEQLAASAIMSRNMSHNIGSHVVFKVISDLQKVLNIKKDDLQTDVKVLERAGVIMKNPKRVRPRHVEEWKNLFDYLEKYKDLLGNSKKHEDLFRYLQVRMDHIAEMTTWEGQIKRPISIGLEELIYDLNSQELLLGYISGVELDHINVTSNIFLNTDGKNDVFVSVPNGMTGAHALYIIIENYIRNLAKHEKVTSDTVKINVVIDDNVEGYQDMIKFSLEVGKGTSIEKTEGESKLKKVEGYIDASIIDKNSRIRENGRGIEEMNLSAGYLRQDKNGEPPLLSPTLDDEGCLKYTFYMQKPKEVLIVSNDKDELPDEKDGIKYIRSASGDKIDHEGYRRVVFLEGNGELRVKKEKQKNLPPRTFSSLEVKDGKKDPYELFNDLDESWCDFLKKRHSFDEELQLVFSEGNLEEERIGNITERISESNRSSECKYAVYYRHAGDYKKDKEEFKKIKENTFFTEIYEERSCIGSILDKKYNESLETFYKQEFRSAALAKVVILDERIQAEVNKHNDSNSEYDPMWILRHAYNRVYVPNKGDCYKGGSIDLYNPDKKTIENYCRNIHKESPIDCIVVHWGVLQKIEKYKRMLEDFERLALSVSICTGRGRAMISVDGENIETVPFSELTRWVCSPGPSKYHLCKLLNL